MSFTEITPYDGLLPTSDDPTSFDVRATALMSWLVANFSPQISALALEIATALNGEADTLTALQALSDSLGDLSGQNRVDLETTAAAFLSGVSNTKYLISPQQLLAALANYHDPDILTWEYSTDVTSVEFTDLGLYSEITVLIQEPLATSPAAKAGLFVSDDNGATWREGNYASFAKDDDSGAIATDRFALFDNGGAGTGINVPRGAIALYAFNRADVCTSACGIAGAVKVTGIYSVAEAHNALRFTFDGGTITQGKIALICRR